MGFVVFVELEDLKAEGPASSQGQRRLRRMAEGGKGARAPCGENVQPPHPVRLDSRPLQGQGGVGETS